MRAISLGLAACLLVYVVGGWMQAASPVWGLVATLTLLLPALTLVGLRVLRHPGEGSAAAALGLARAAPRHLAAALLLAPALALVVTRVFELQSRILPLPELSFPDELLALAPPWRVLCLAVLPGVFEELLFRGALLRALRRDLPAARAVLIQAALFGLVHASAHRLLPTALVGTLLGALSLRARSLWPAMLLHAGYNTVLVLELPGTAAWSPGLALALGAAGALLGALPRPANGAARAA